MKILQWKMKIFQQKMKILVLKNVMICVVDRWRWDRSARRRALHLVHFRLKNVFDFRLKALRFSLTNLSFIYHRMQGSLAAMTPCWLRSGHTQRGGRARSLTRIPTYRYRSTKHSAVAGPLQDRRPARSLRGSSLALYVLTLKMTISD